MKRFSAQDWKVSIFCWIMALMAYQALPPASAFPSTSPTIGLDITGSGNTLKVKVTMVAGRGENIRAAGLDLVFPSNLLRFQEVESLDGALVKGNNISANLVRLGFVDTGTGGREKVELDLRFEMLGPSDPQCIPIGIRPSTLEGDVAGAIISGVRAYCPTPPNEPIIWSSPDESAVLFLIVPRVTGLKAAGLMYQGVDITGPLALAGEYFFDPLKDCLYYILPGIEIPEGAYPLDMNWNYGDGMKQSAVTVTVQK